MADPKSERDLRRSARVEMQTEFRLGDALGFGEIALDTHDLSSGGAFIKADLLFEVDEEIEVEFTLPRDGRVIRSRARVAWVSRGDDAGRPAGMGVQFLGLADADRRLLADFLGA